MNREDAKDLTLSLLVVAIGLLIIHAVFLHCRYASQSIELKGLKTAVERHLLTAETNPSFAEKAKEAYDKLKSAAVEGYKAARKELDEK